MATFSNMVDEVLQNLSGYGMKNDSVTHVTSSPSFSSTELSFLVNNASLIGRGVIEIDDELIWVDSFDRASGTVSVPPYGRGYMGTTASSHNYGAKVSINPLFSRSAIKRAINDTIRAVYPALFGVSSSTFTFSPAVTTYALPNDLESIISISYRRIGPEKEWVPLRNYRVDSAADISEFNSNNSVTISAPITPGSTVKVQYSKEPDELMLDGDDFNYTTGLPESCKDLIVLGATYRLLSMVEPGRLTFATPESQTQSERIQYGSGTNIVRYIFALYQQRLTEESNKMSRKFPIRAHYTG